MVLLHEFTWEKVRNYSYTPSKVPMISADDLIRKVAELKSPWFCIMSFTGAQVLNEHYTPSKPSQKRF